MSRHLSANLWLLGLTLLLCCVLYPLILWGFGQTLFPHQAEGSLIDEKGNPVTDPAQARGSRLIGQAFKGKEYFQPRPSATSEKPYNAMASGASNWGASNPLLRLRVARLLGPIVRYDPKSPTKPKGTVQEAIEAWFRDQVKKDPRFEGPWARAEQWVTENAEAVAGWRKKPMDEIKKNSGKTTQEFFSAFAKKHPAAWPSVEDQTIGDKTIKVIKPVPKGPDIQSYFFERWLEANQEAIQKGKIILEKVPADMVMASGSGLDPHITLDSANYQLPDVVDAWAEKLKMPEGKAGIKAEIEALLKEKAAAPLGGLVGVPLINVLEVNLALRERMPRLADSGK
jgi:K+-transporting ATPase ATPase C chain